MNVLNEFLVVVCIHPRQKYFVKVTRIVLCQKKKLNIVNFESFFCGKAGIAVIL